MLAGEPLVGVLRPHLGELADGLFPDLLGPADVGGVELLVEAGDLEAEIDPTERKVPELLGQQLVIPGRDFGQPVIGDHKGTGLGRGQVIEAQGRHLGHAELTAGH